MWIMKTVELTQLQVDRVISNLAEEHDTKGRFVVDIKVDDSLEVTAEGWVDIDGYVEDDYYNGTGAFVETYRKADVKLTGWHYNHETDDEEEVEISEVSVKKIHDYLNAA